MKLLSDQFLSAPGWVHYLNGRLPDETPHVDDDFFGQDSNGDYTTQTVTGTATWTISRGVLSAKFDDQDASDLSGFLKSITSASAPMTVEARMTFTGFPVDNPVAGIAFTDGTATTSNVASAVLMNFDTTFITNQARLRHGTMTAMSGSATLMTAIGLGVQQVYLRIIWKSANTFQAAISLDGVTWTNQAMSNVSKTMTPTHIGFIASTWANTLEHLASFDYLRVYDSDLSV